MAQTQAGLKQVGCETMAKTVVRDSFLIPQEVATAFMAYWVPPVFIWAVAGGTSWSL
jgi:hypothetical protein